MNNYTPSASDVRAYMLRPKDQTFRTLAELYATCQYDREHSHEASYAWKDLQVVPSPDGQAVMLQSPRRAAQFTHWSFGQLCRSVGAPASYVSSLPPENIARDLTFGLSRTAPASDAKILVRANGGSPIVRACTSETYGRLWDAEWIGAIQDSLVSMGNGWEVELATRSDRDTFVTFSNKRSVLEDPSTRAIVNDPSADVGGIMYRSLTIGNSEVGAGSVWYQAGIYRARCKNLMLWSASVDGTFRRRHVGEKVFRDTMRAIFHLARRYATQSTENDQRLIRLLIDREIAETKTAVVDELKALGATKEQAIEAYERCELTEHASPRSFWGLAQGLTRLSQDREYQNERIALDQLAGKLLSRGQRLVAA